MINVALRTSEKNPFDNLIEKLEKSGATKDPKKNIWTAKGDFETSVKQHFKGLPGKAVSKPAEGKQVMVKQTADYGTYIARDWSTDDGAPTLEWQKPNSNQSKKIRFVN